MNILTFLCLILCSILSVQAFLKRSEDLRLYSAGVSAFLFVFLLDIYFPEDQVAETFWLLVLGGGLYEGAKYLWKRRKKE